MVDHFYAVIMAGGGGTRLWPVSRKAAPKQLIKLFGDRSLFQIAVDRLAGLFPADKIFVVTISEQVEELRRQTPQIPERNFLIEPAPKGTASVVAMAAGAIHKFDPDAILAVLTADHIIDEINLFQKVLTSASELAGMGYLVTIGIKPDFPSTGYGYIQSGEKLWQVGDLAAYKVEKFVEKPDADRAREFLNQITMNWNSGMFIFRASVMLEEFAFHMPELAASIQSLLPLLGIDHTTSEFEHVWHALKPQTIDFGIMEKSRRAAVIPVKNLGWFDVGSWDSLFDVLEPDQNGNIILNARHISLESSGSLVVSDGSDSLIVTLGLKDLIIVKTDEALLICPRGESQRVKELVNYLKNNHYSNYL